MSLRPSRLCAETFLLLPAVFFLAGCAVPLAPGYAVENESLDVRFLPGRPGHVAVRAQYQLRNVGNADLSYVNVILPGCEQSDARNVRVAVDGREVAVAPVSEAGGTGAAQIVFPSLWPKKQRRALEISYDLFRAANCVWISDDGASVFLKDSGWWPQLEPPKVLFAHGVERPDPTELTVMVPKDFLVISRGRAEGARRRERELAYRFWLHAKDLDPFVLAGRYHEQSFHSSGTKVVLWTFPPSGVGNLRAAVDPIAQAWRAFETSFGNPSLPPDTVRVAEWNAPKNRHSAPEGFAAPFPGGVLVGPRDLAAHTEVYIEEVQRALAHTWFGDQVRFRPEAWLILGKGLPTYATIVAEEASGGAAGRRARIAALLREYDEAAREATEKPLAMLSAGDPAGQLRIGLAKAPLFFAALEDEFGEAPVRRGLAHLVRALGGEAAGIDDLRAALEEATGKDLAEFFREWLEGKEIPASFRDEFEKPPPDAARSGNLGVVPRRVPVEQIPNSIPMKEGK